MTPVFEWDAAKASANVRKHGVGFEEALTVVSFTERGPRTRIIAARNATRAERRDHEQRTAKGTR